MVAHAARRAVGERRGGLSRPAVAAVAEGGDFVLGRVDRGEDAPRAVAARHPGAEEREHQRHLGIDARVDPGEGAQGGDVARLADEGEAARGVEPRGDVGERRRGGVARPRRREHLGCGTCRDRRVGQRVAGVHRCRHDAINGTAGQGISQDRREHAARRCVVAQGRVGRVAGRDRPPRPPQRIVVGGVGAVVDDQTGAGRGDGGFGVRGNRRGLLRAAVAGCDRCQRDRSRGQRRAQAAARAAVAARDAGEGRGGCHLPLPVNRLMPQT